MERRLQTQVFKLGLAKSIHHARILVKQRHIRYSRATNPRSSRPHCGSFAVYSCLHFSRYSVTHPSPPISPVPSAAFASRL